jgi:hypothetical protein
MRCLSILAGIAVLLLVILAVVLTPNPIGAAIAGRLHDATLSSTLTYRVQVWSDAPLMDLDLIVPLPAGPEGEALVSALTRGDLQQWPRGWQLAILEAGDFSFLEIRADRFGEEPLALAGGTGIARTARAIGSPGPWQEDLVIRVWPGRMITTDAPEGREPLLWPRYNVTAVCCGCGCAVAQGSSDRFVYDSTIHTGFRGPQGAHLAAWVQVQGVNRWWAYHWSSNHYSDSVRLLVRTPAEGWQPAMGMLSQKNGRYGRPSGF